MGTVAPEVCPQIPLPLSIDTSEGQGDSNLAVHSQSLSIRALDVPKVASLSSPYSEPLPWSPLPSTFLWVMLTVLLRPLPNIYANMLIAENSHTVCYCQGFMMLRNVLSQSHRASQLLVPHLYFPVASPTGAAAHTCTTDGLQKKELFLKKTMHYAVPCYLLFAL